MNNEKNNKLRRYADLLDTRYRIPGTNIRFGLDFLIGIIPGFGDIVSFLLSSGLVVTMIGKGASGKALALMLLNLFLDTTLGSIPVIGDVFDLFFKANKRNLNLYQEHFEDGKHQGSAWQVVIPVLIVIIILLIVIGWLIFWVLSGIFNLLI